VVAKKVKKVQKDLDGNVVSPVSVDKEPVNHVKETYRTTKFKVPTKDCDVSEAIENGELEELVRQKIRPFKGAVITDGDYDDAVKEILKKVEGD
jgi:hypothetical protein